MRALKRLGITTAIAATAATVIFYGVEKTFNARLPGAAWWAMVVGPVGGVMGYHAYLSRRREPVENVRQAVEEVLDDRLTNLTVQLNEDQLRMLGAALSLKSANPERVGSAPPATTGYSQPVQEDLWDTIPAAIPTPLPQHTTARREVDWGNIT